MDASRPSPVCPRCGYDQSGAVATWTDRCPVAGTCPECGFGFSWSDAFGLSPDQMRWSFEHARGYIASLWRLPGTLARCVLPTRYWRRMGRYEPIRIDRIVLLLLLVPLLARVLWSVPMSMAACMDYYGRGGFDPTFWRSIGLEQASDLFVRCLLGSGESAWRLNSETWSDSYEGLFLALPSVFVSMSWFVILMLTVLFSSCVQEHRVHYLRAGLMSFVCIAPAYETIRLIRSAQNALPWMADMYLSLFAGFGAVVWVLAWWSAAVRVIHPTWSPSRVAAIHGLAFFSGILAQVSLFLVIVLR